MLLVQYTCTRIRMSTCRMLICCCPKILDLHGKLDGPGCEVYVHTCENVNVKLFLRKCRIAEHLVRLFLLFHDAKLSFLFTVRLSVHSYTK
jgi:hypothetical protein